MAGQVAKKLNRAQEADVWFEDGNIILVADDGTPFKVHRGVLTQKSQVFHDMYEFPQPSHTNDGDSMDGVPIVHVSDSWEDLRYMLMGLYHGQKYLGYNRCIEFPMVSALLRLGSKYQIQELCDEAIARLKICFPVSFSEFRNALTAGELLLERKNLNDVVCRPKVINLEKNHAIEVVNLARMYDIPSLLPSAFYVCAQLNTMDLLAGLEDPSLPSLSPSDFRILLNGQRTLVNTELMYMKRVMFAGPSDTCISKETCRSEISTIFRDRWAWIVNAAGSSLADPLWVYDHLRITVACEDCKAKVRERVDEFRRFTWRMLGKYFCVEPWPMEATD